VIFSNFFDFSSSVLRVSPEIDSRHLDQSVSELIESAAETMTLNYDEDCLSY